MPDRPHGETAPSPCPEASVPPPTHQLQRGAACTLLAGRQAGHSIGFERSNTILLMFYLEYLLTFLFPFYRPSILQGGRAWVLEMMISSPVVRQATLCQSSYFFSLAQKTGHGDEIWDTVMTKTGDAFRVLERSLQVITDSSITEHLHGAVRILASIMQLQRFEIAVLSFHNCQSHFHAALALFKQLLDSSTAAEPPAGPAAGFDSLLCRLGPPSWMEHGQLPIPSAEQAAFRFSSTLLILDDIIASTVLQEQPQLYEYHHDLLCSIDDGVAKPRIDLEAVVGCQNWVLLHIGEIAKLDAWKQQCKQARDFDVLEFVRRATAIKDSLEACLTRLDADQVMLPIENGESLLDVLNPGYCQQQPNTPTTSEKSSLATRVWAHAAHIYLLVVMSGWQPASSAVRYHVGRIIELLTHQVSPPALLRTMVWPFCVAGCLAEPAQEVHLRGIAEALQPPSVFGTVRKALEIMEGVWRNRDGDVANRDLATCFRSQGDLVLLV
ncbi:hypothetical protein M406DRAFT_264737 [Cryphonectria parasitica EP155]|uniref:Uncharacterized protein n=1 Tax=Cryphonectria parasitica (strain ATCC 38755 / EP155) TaxID=660469 RepID=A0A9P5CLQ8_CRYP1|nr:uncharacterized protein M406DRAFT_264737 [Cryphonectria parasitica EP155]KAF3762276.1 hypothetical protein M406DRAFT_264737 [Cryphonectria parasitica EP155]